MEKYSVTQVAKMLRTNPETVRRWIRSGKLNAVQISRKDGNVIEENELKRFVKNSPKYANILNFSQIPTGRGLSGVVSGVATSLAVSLVLGHIDDKNNRDFMVDDNAIEEYIKKSIADGEVILQNKTKEVEKLKDEIKEEKNKIEELKKILSHLKK